MSLKIQQQEIGPARFVIGYVEGRCYFTNMPAYPTISNEELLAMDNFQLERLAYTRIGKDESIAVEKYIRPSFGKDAEAQGGTSNEEYYAPHRAKCILDFRRDRIKNRVKQIEDKDIIDKRCPCGKGYSSFEEVGMQIIVRCTDKNCKEKLNFAL